MAVSSTYHPTHRPSHTRTYTSARGTRKASVSTGRKFSRDQAATVAAMAAKWSRVRHTRVAPPSAKGRVATPISAPKANHSRSPSAAPRASGTRALKQKVKSSAKEPPKNAPGWVTKDSSR